jgi:hypothetical protein
MKWKIISIEYIGLIIKISEIFKQTVWCLLQQYCKYMCLQKEGIYIATMLF